MNASHLQLVSGNSRSLAHTAYKQGQQAQHANRGFKFYQDEHDFHVVRMSGSFAEVCQALDVLIACENKLKPH